MTDFLSPWYDALSSRFGIVLSTSEPNRVKQKLYIARTKAQDPDLEQVSIIVSPTEPNQLWLLKNGKANGAT